MTTKTNVSILQRQRRMVRLGKIRLGDYDESAGRPVNLENWRLTSSNRAALEQVARMYGGEIHPWDKKPGHFELFCGSNELFVAIHQFPWTQGWEYHTAQGCLRRCDGAGGKCCHWRDLKGAWIEEEVDCYCGSLKEKDQCRLITRLPFEIAGIGVPGCWVLETGSKNAALELPAMYDWILEQAKAAGHSSALAILTKEARQSKTPGKARSDYFVPMLTIRSTQIDEFMSKKPVSISAAMGMPALAAPTRQALGLGEDAADELDDAPQEAGLPPEQAKADDPPSPAQPTLDAESGEGEAPEAEYVVSAEDAAALAQDFGLRQEHADRLASFRGVPSLDDLRAALQAVRDNPIRLNLGNLVMRVQSYPALLAEFGKIKDGPGR